MKRAAVSSMVVVGLVVLTPVLRGQGYPPAPSFKPHPSTQEPARLVTLDTLKRWEQELSNWGRWGKDDQRGLLNLITPEKTRSALALVKEGRTVTLQINPIKADAGQHGTADRRQRVHRRRGA